MNGNIYGLCQKHYQENAVAKMENFVFLSTENFLDMQGCTRVGTLIVATIYLQLIQN